MKNQIVFLLLYSIVLIKPLSCQVWIPQGQDFLTEDYLTWSISAVDEETVFALSFSLLTFNDVLVYSFDGGETWNQNDLEVFNNVSIYDIEATSADSIWIVVENYTTEQTSLHRSVDGGETWGLLLSYNGNGAAGPVLEIGADHSIYLVDPISLSCHTSTDGGLSWETYTITPPFSGGETWGIGNPTGWLDSHENSLWFGTSQYVRRSEDGGQTWSTSDNAFTATFEISSVAFNETGVGMAVSSRKNGNLSEAEAGIQYSNDWGATWEERSSLGFNVESVAAIPGTEEGFIAVGGLFLEFVTGFEPTFGSAYTLDGGINWTIIDSLPHNGLSFASTEIGWTGRLASFTYDGNPVMYKWDGSTLDASDNKPDHQVKISPNPFDEHLIIQLPSNLPVDIILRNLSGQIVYSTFSNRSLVEISDLALLPSGIYTLEIKGEDFNYVEKVVNF